MVVVGRRGIIIIIIMGIIHAKWQQQQRKKKKVKVNTTEPVLFTRVWFIAAAVPMLITGDEEAAEATRPWLRFIE